MHVLHTKQTLKLSFSKISGIRRSHFLNYQSVQIPKTTYRDSKIEGVLSQGVHKDCQKSFETKFKIYDALENKKVNLSTVRPNIVNWYSCGPTVYSSAHIGHASSYVRQDVVRRILEYLGKDICVVQIMGITDIDDKIIKAADELKVSWQMLTKQYEEDFVQDLKQLNVRLPHVWTKVSDYIPHVIDFVQSLLKSGFAYVAEDGSVYFDTSKYKNYGIFRKSGEWNDDERVQNKNKIHSRDFSLWKGVKPGEPFWVAPWGRGRPGWHIECSVMASHFFGERLDVHSGGQDLIFPHHENEETQCCAKFNSNQWVSHWLHTGHLHFKGDLKMSKSLGNTLLIKDFLKTESADVFRMFCILSKYNNSLEFTPESLNNGRNVLSKLESFINDCDSAIQGIKKINPLPGSESFMWERFIEMRTNIHHCLMDDFDTPRAFSILLSYLHDFNKSIFSTEGSGNPLMNFGLLITTKSFLQNFLTILGIKSFANGVVIQQVENNDFEPLVTEMVKFRNDVRFYSLAFEEKDSKLKKSKLQERKDLIAACDKMRLTLSNYGIDIKDHGEKSSWIRKRPS